MPPAFTQRMSSSISSSALTLSSREQIIDKCGVSFSRTFIFDRNSVLDATLYYNGSPQYTIVTTKANSRTDIFGAGAKCVVATIKRREILPDTIKFPSRGEASSVAINKWLKPTCEQNESSFASLYTDIGTFIWKTDATYRLALYTESHAQPGPIASMTRPHPPEPLALKLEEGYDQILEDILVSFIVMEQRLRMKEKKRANAMLYGPVYSGM